MKYYGYIIGYIIGYPLDT